MLSKNQKRLTLLYFALLISFLIWNINQNVFDNTFNVCFILSLTTFLIIFTPFEIYWTFQDFWFERWKKMHISDVVLTRLKILIMKNKRGKARYISTLLISSRNKDLVSTKNTIIIVSHGFSDTKESLQFFYIPLALQGYTIIAYDSRGTKGSKKVGKKSQFLDRIEDYKKILHWVKGYELLGGMQIYSVGFSIGAMTVLCGSFADKEVSKIIAISSISSYKKNIKSFNPIVLLNYIFKGIRIFPPEEISNRLSPSHIISELKIRVQSKDWLAFANRVLLIHAKNDKIIKFFNFDQNRSLLELKSDNLLILKKGGHSHKKNELAIIGKTIQFLSN